MNSCPCGNTLEYNQCCEPIHNNHSLADTPEKLMRSRYSAHVKGLVDYVVNTYHPSCHAEEQRDAIADSIKSEWCGLEVIESEPGLNSEEGFVTFKAFFNEEEKQYCLEERSRFVRENALWFYIDGTFPEETTVDPRLEQTVQSLKVGRNDPCICGSGKKFKKCCG
ncbi:YchJ family protein [Vibrio sp. RE86]|uniref:YchJ family protein n=1 Tax=Vibrio sp. RE86 TaxID=2607605 RepID=UPI0014934FC7|nr:YchJ family protein [Vibrio sp. RE86]NOH79424.1 YchJ family protein [Vibrio sp. RE86]